MRQQKPETFNSNIRPFLEAEYLMAYKDDAKILNVSQIVNFQFDVHSFYHLLKIGYLQRARTN